MRLLMALGAVALVLAGVTLVALEGRDVVRLRTRGADGDGAAWIEAYRALPQPGPEGHATVRRLLRERYGFADLWVGLLQDTSRSVGVRLEPEVSP